MTANLLFESVRQLGEMVCSKRVSPVELTDLFLGRLESLGPLLNAVVTVTRKQALKQARIAEKEIMAGRYRGPLHGIPYGAKDLLATAGGIPTTWGAAPLRHQVFGEDATVIRKLAEAGAVLAGKLAMVELAGGMGYRFPNASFTGPGITPWDLNMWSGGSSSGSASSVAAGLVPFAIGSETWGSILGPANNCGIAGLRPTYGRVSRYGAMALCWTLDKIGPLCRNADDCGLVLEAIAGADPRDPTTTRRRYRYRPGARRRKWKVGVFRGVADGVQEEVRVNFERALAALAPRARIETVEPPALPCEEITRTILFAEASSAFDTLIEDGRVAELTAPEDRYTPYVRSAILAGDYLRALRLRGIMAREVDRILERFDVLVGPSRATTATPLDREFRSVSGGDSNDLMGAIGNGAGLPAIGVPSGFSEAGLPTGIQFMGRAYNENLVIAVARTYQSLTDWHLKRPPEPAP